MNVTFEEATYKDVEGIIKLCNECFLESTPLEFAKTVFKETESDKNQIYLIGVYNNEIIAHTKITIIPTMYMDMNTYAILNHVCVKEEYRKHDIATHMLDEVSRICQNRGCKTMKLWSNNYREAAHGCYKKYGFEINDASFFTKSL